QRWQIDAPATELAVYAGARSTRDRIDRLLAVGTPTAWLRVMKTIPTADLAGISGGASAFGPLDPIFGYVRDFLSLEPRVQLRLPRNGPVQRSALTATPALLP